MGEGESLKEIRSQGQPQNPAPEFSEKDLLAGFEQVHISSHYKSYYMTKRHNFFATIQQFSYLWNSYMLMDRILCREFEIMMELRAPQLMLPMVLFMNAHAKMRVAFELGSAGCLSEAHSILRDAIESVAHANRIASDPSLLKPWIEKNDGMTALESFKKEFEHDKTKRLFDGLPELHQLWKQFSEFGSHTNLNSIVSRFVIEQTPTHLQYRLNYCGAEPGMAVMVLFEMILSFDQMESCIFKVCQDRLKLDLELPGMRSQFALEKEKVRAHITKTYNVQRPASRP